MAGSHREIAGGRAASEGAARAGRSSMPVTKTSLGLCAAGSALVATCRYAWKKKIDTLYRFAYFFQYPVLGAGVLMSVQPENESMIEVRILLSLFLILRAAC